MEKIEWPIKNQNAKYKFEENPSKESSINISKEIFDFLGGKENGDIISVTLRKKDFLLAFSKVISNLPLFYWSKDCCQKAEFSSDFFETNYSEIEEHFGDNERIQYKIKLRINDESTTRYYMYRIDGMKNFILRDFLIGENSSLIFIKNDNGELIIVPVVDVKKNQKNEENALQNEKSSLFPNVPPQQTILYGVPGSGKSYTIAKELETLGINKENESEYTKRVVFHPEYTNTDFIGQILPQSKENGEKISYPFAAGPFTQILAKAYTHKNKNYALIIEEINRGNAAAIFGELFQLLDRLSEDENGSANGYTYTKGWSSYPITNDNINKAIFEAYSKNQADNDFAPFIPKENFEKYGLNIGIRLPPNLSLFATMNTSDQNVFKLDNAFKRRWDLQLIQNEFGETADEINQRDAQVEGFDFTWEQFRKAINEIITSSEWNSDYSSFSDKQIGCWFSKAIKTENGDFIIAKHSFVNKVLEYLWDDVFSYEPNTIFKDDFKTFENLSEAIIDNENSDIFKESVKTKIDYYQDKIKNEIKPNNPIKRIKREKTNFEDAGIKIGETITFSKDGTLAIVKENNKVSINGNEPISLTRASKQLVGASAKETMNPYDYWTYNGKTITELFLSKLRQQKKE